MDAATRSPHPAVVLFAIHTPALVVLGALDAALLTRANMSVGSGVGLLAINVGLAPLQ